MHKERSEVVDIGVGGRFEVGKVAHISPRAGTSVGPVGVELVTGWSEHAIC